MLVFVFGEGKFSVCEISVICGKEKLILFEVLEKMLAQFRNQRINTCFPLLILFIALKLAITAVECEKSVKIGDYVTLCKKDDPDLNNCLTNSLESLRSKFKEGIPEIGLAPLDPMLIPEVHALNEKHMKMIGKDVKIIGISNFKIHSIEADFNKLTLNISVFFPNIIVDGKYDVDAVLMGMPVIGQGPMHGNCNDIEYAASFKGSVTEINGHKRFHLISAKTNNIHVKHYNITLSNLFPNKVLNDAVNSMINNAETSSNIEMMNIMKNIVSNVLLEVLNKYILNLLLDDIFK